MSRLLGVIAGLMTASVGFGQTPEEIAERSSRLFQEAVETIESDHAGALGRLEESIALLESLIDEHGIENASIHYNIANAYALANRLGRAVVHYHLALRHDPRDQAAADNLAYVRGRVPERLGPTPETSTTRRVLEAVPTRLRFGLFVLTLVSVWALLAIRLLVNEKARRGTDPLLADEGTAPGVPRWPALCALALALVLGTSLALDLLWPRPTIGVVVDAPTIARQGPSDAAYDPAFTRPVSPGIEFRVLELRDGIDAPGRWVLAEFGDGRRAWFRRSAVALVEE